MNLTENELILLAAFNDINNPMRWVSVKEIRRSIRDKFSIGLDEFRLLLAHLVTLNLVELNVSMWNKPICRTTEYYLTLTTSEK